MLSGDCPIFGWGHNHRGQLGGVEGAKVRMPTGCESIAKLSPVLVAGGEQTLFIVSSDGKVSSSSRNFYFMLPVFLQCRAEGRPLSFVVNVKFP